MADKSTATIYIDAPSDHSFRSTVYSHGWCDLAPFSLDEKEWRLTYVFDRGVTGGPPVSAVMSEVNRQIRIDVGGRLNDPDRVRAAALHLLRLDDDLTDFYNTVDEHGRLGWVLERRAGRLLRSATVFEDLVKTICTTNCSWGLTKIMVNNLVEKLGEQAADGRRAFPTPAAMAAADAGFYREEVRAGYRSPYFVELAEAVASGRLDPEQWLTSDLATAELKREMKTVKGVGDYAAENLLKLVGRYDGLALDSWLRSQFYKTHNAHKKCSDKKIERHYKRFGKWRGLAIWCDMTEKWITDEN